MGRAGSTNLLAMVVWTIAIASGQQPQQTPRYVTEQRLVNVTFVVADRGGAFRADLERSDFDVYEDGEPREILAFSGESDLPLTIGLLFESKEVTRAFLDVSKHLTLGFLRTVLRPDDRVFLVAVRPDTRLLLEETGSLETVESVFGDLDRRVQAAPVWRAGWSYKIVDDMALALERKLANARGRKAMLLLQAGWDWRSKTSAADLIERLQSADVIVYHLKIPNTIDKVRYVSPVIGPLDLLFIRRPMAKICIETGGAQFAEREFSSAFDTIERELRSNYTIAFRPGRTAPDRKFHRITIRSKRPSLKVRHRAGYRDGL